MSISETGYLKSTQQILETTTEIKQNIENMPELQTVGDGLWIVAFTSDGFDIYRVLDRMASRGWGLVGLQRPPAVHLCVTPRHVQPGVAERFLSDLRDAVEHVRSNPKEKGGMAPVYGTASTMPFRGVVGDLLKRYLDLLYEP